MKREVIIVALILISIALVAADDFNVGVEVSDGRLGSEKGFFYNIFINPLLKLFQAFGVITGGKCETGYGGKDCPPGEQCSFLVGCEGRICQYDYAKAGTPCTIDGIEGLCDEAGACVKPEVVEEIPSIGVCGDDCVDKYSCSKNDRGLIIKTASCDLTTGTCSFSEPETTSCGICEICGIVDYSGYIDDIEDAEGLTTEKPGLAGVREIMWVVNEASKLLTSIIAEYFFSDLGILYKLGNFGIAQALFGQIGLPNPNELKKLGDIEVPAPPIYFEPQRSFPTISSEGLTCIPDAECEKEKKICKEYVYDEAVDSFCKDYQNPENIECIRKSSVCDTKYFSIKKFTINGVKNSDFDECCEYARQLELKRCEHMVNIFYNPKTKALDSLLKSDSKADVYISVRNDDESKGDTKNGRILSMTLEGSKEEIFNSVIPGEIMSSIWWMTYNYPITPWIDEGMSMSVADKNKKCKNFEKVVDAWKQGQLYNLDALFGTGHRKNILLMPGQLDFDLLDAESWLFTEFLLQKDSRNFKERNWRLRKLFYNFMLEGKNNLVGGYNPVNAWKNALIKYYGFRYDEQGSLNIEKEWHDWIKAQLSPNGEIYAEGVINPCICLTREEYEKRI